MTFHKLHHFVPTYPSEGTYRIGMTSLVSSLQLSKPSIPSLFCRQAEAEVAALGDFDWTADLSLFDEQVYAESLHEVPQFPHMGGGTGAGAGFGMGKTQNPLKGRARYDMAAVVPDYDDSFVVPDLGMDVMTPVTKKRRNGYM